MLVSNIIYPSQLEGYIEHAPPGSIQTAAHTKNIIAFGPRKF